MLNVAKYGCGHPNCIVHSPLVVEVHVYKVGVIEDI